MDVPTLREKYFIDDFDCGNVRDRILGIFTKLLKKSYPETVILTWLIKQLRNLGNSDICFREILLHNVRLRQKQLKDKTIWARDRVLELAHKLELLEAQLSRKDQHPLLTEEYIYQKFDRYKIENLWTKWIRDGRELKHQRDAKDELVKLFVGKARELNLSEKIIQSILQDDVMKKREELDYAHREVIDSENAYKEFKENENTIRSEIQALKLTDIELDPKEEIDVEKLTKELEEKKVNIERELRLIAKRGRELSLDVMRFEPTLHDEVIFLIGLLVARHYLPLRILEIQKGFPDMTALYYCNDEWQEKKIEIEVESADFRQHINDGKNIEDCDMIICWRDNWPEPYPDSPYDFPKHIEVIELQEFVKNLPR